MPAFCCVDLLQVFLDSYDLSYCFFLFKFPSFIGNVIQIKYADLQIPVFINPIFAQFQKKDKCYKKNHKKNLSGELNLPEPTHQIYIV